MGINNDNISLTSNSEIVHEDFTVVIFQIGANQDDYEVSEFIAHYCAMSLLMNWICYMQILLGQFL